MRKEASLTIILLLLFFNVGAYPAKELVSNHFFSPRRADGTPYSHSVFSVQNGVDFYRTVVENSKPTVALVAAGVENGALGSMYREVASEFRGKVSFARMNISSVLGIVRMIMSKLGVAQVTLPLFLFFKRGALLLPVVAGLVEKERLIEHVNQRFFSPDVSIHGARAPVLRLKARGKGVRKESGVSTWNTLGNLGEKIKKWLLSWQTVSREVKAYQLSKTRRYRKTF